MSKFDWFVFGVSIATSACAGGNTPEPEVAEPVATDATTADPTTSDPTGAEAAPPEAPAAEVVETAPAAPPRGKRAPCVLGQDQTCNGDPKVSAIWGKCTEGGTCECNPGFVLAPTGYCQPQQ